MNEAKSKSIPSMPPKPLRMHIDHKLSTILQVRLNFATTEMKHQIFSRAIEMIDNPKQIPSVTLKNPSTHIKLKIPQKFTLLEPDSKGTTPLQKVPILIKVNKINKINKPS